MKPASYLYYIPRRLFKKTIQIRTKLKNNFSEKENSFANSVRKNVKQNRIHMKQKRERLIVSANTAQERLL